MEVADPTTVVLVPWLSGTQLYQVRPVIGGVETSQSTGVWSTR